MFRPERLSGMWHASLLFLLFLLGSADLCPRPAYGQNTESSSSSLLQEGTASYYQNNYTKAVDLLTMAERILWPLALAADGQEGSVEPQVVDDLLWGR